MMSDKQNTAVYSIAAALAVLVLAAPVRTLAMSDAELACRSTLSSSMAKYVKALQKAIVGCHKARDKGDASVAAVDCNSVSAANTFSGGKVADAETKATTDVTGACTGVTAVLAEFPQCPAPFQALDSGGATSGIDTSDELIDCQIAHAQAIVSKLYEQTLGHPATGMGSEQQKCHGAIAKAVSKLVDTTAKVRSSCQKAADKAGGSVQFVCATSDPKFKIDGAASKGEAAIQSACAFGLAAAVDSCAGSAGGIASCAIADAAAAAAGGLASMPWKLPGICPGGANLRVEGRLKDTDVDFGAPGYAHDIRPPSGFTEAKYEFACDADCANCVTSAVTPASDNCRCSGNASVVCSSNPDCSGAGGTCTCFLTPPVPLVASSTPLCATNAVSGSLTGSLQPVNGAATLSGSSNMKIYLGETIAKPCPVCVAGVCDGGARDGLSCTADASDSTFGEVSFDCPPHTGALVNGAGSTVPINLSTGSFSLAFNVPCDNPGYGGFDCACSTCSLDNSIGCNSDAECAAQGAGVCRTDGGHGGWFRKPNECVDGVCSADPSGAAHEGKCLAGSNNGANDLYCDGLVRADGGGVVGCLDQSSCNSLVDTCYPGPGCGLCAISQKHECFLDPIAAAGSPGTRLVGGGCIAPTANTSLNIIFGLPGAFRTQQAISVQPLCPDHATPYQAPGGSNCP